jgi:hypothetical protein
MEEIAFREWLNVSNKIHHHQNNSPSSIHYSLHQCTIITISFLSHLTGKSKHLALLLFLLLLINLQSFFFILFYPFILFSLFAYQSQKERQYAHFNKMHR